jgi:hypothetical protein
MEWIMNDDGGGKRATPVVVLLAVMLEFLGGARAPLRAASPQTGCYTREGLEPKVQAIVEEFRASVPGIIA